MISHVLRSLRHRNFRLFFAGQFISDECRARELDHGAHFVLDFSFGACGIGLRFDDGLDGIEFFKRDHVGHFDLWSWVKTGFFGL